jgi:pyruvyltransferase
VQLRTRMMTLLKRILPGPALSVLRAAALLRHSAARGVLPLSLKAALSPSYIIAYWWEPRHLSNFGDALNPILIEALSGKKVVHLSRVENLARKPVYYVTGSILSHISNSDAVVWGSGFIDSRDTLRTHPRKVMAVRGPLTRGKLLQLGVECPEVYGDPALLCPLFFKPSASKRYALGVVPHLVDRESPLLDKFRQMSTVSVIDVTASVESVIRAVTECEVIASSALHGLIVADAYGIPSTWIRISGKLAGDDFKFRDYFLSVGRRDAAPVQLAYGTTPGDLLPSRPGYRIELDLGKLLKTCPFSGDRLPVSVARNEVG